MARPGDRVRVTAPECELRKQTGVLRSLENYLFSATLGDKDVQCPFEALTRLEVSVGERKWWKTSVIGLGIGLGVGAVGVIAITSDPKPGTDMYGLAAALWAVASTSAGLLVGTGIGIIRGRDHWEEVPLPLVLPYFGPSLDGRLNFGFSIPPGR